MTEWPVQPRLFLCNGRVTRDVDYVHVEKSRYLSEQTELAVLRQKVREMKRTRDNAPGETDRRAIGG